MKIGFKTFRDPSIVPIYGPCGVHNCIVVLIEVVNCECEKWKLFYLVPSAKYCGLVVGIEFFSPYKYLLLDDEVV